MTPEERAARLIVECNLDTAVRHQLAAVIREAEAVLLAAPVPDALDEKRLSQVYELADNALRVYGPDGLMYHVLRDLRADNVHLRRALQEIASSGPEAEAWCKGHDAGRQALTEQLLAAAKQMAVEDTGWKGWEHVVREVIQRVKKGGQQP